MRQLIRRVIRENPLWGAPKIHGELLKLGINISESTVSKYLVRHKGSPSQSWRTYLENHVKELFLRISSWFRRFGFRFCTSFLVLAHELRGPGT
jgi:hypothetical protein